MSRLSVIILLLVSNSLFAANFTEDLVKAAIQRTAYSVEYDGSYYVIDYPNGDVPANRGVCTDVIVRSYRGIGTDLQKLIHQDMTSDFDAYPSRRIWGLNRSDKNIDHRRVPNMRVFFSRHGQVLTISNKPGDYQPGDLVTWMLPGNLPHIGIVSDQHSPHSSNPLIVHNMGRGPVLEDMLFDFTITGHYRFIPKNYQ